MTGAQRLQKLISAAGIASRRTAEAMIAEGRVTVNGVPAAVGMSMWCVSTAGPSPPGHPGGILC